MRVLDEHLCKRDLGKQANSNTGQNTSPDRPPHLTHSLEE